MTGGAASPHGRTSTMVFGTWRVGTRERQRAAIAAIRAAWRTRPWPDAGLRSYDVLAGTDGTTLLHRSAWSTPDGGSTTAPDPSWKAEVDRAVPGIERQGVVATRLHRTRTIDGRTIDGRTQPPGCIVLVTRVFDGPDVERAGQLVDALFDSTDAAPPPPGLLAVRFYVGLDGRHVFNWAEWTDEEAHRVALTREPPETVDRRRWQQVHDWPGLVSTSFARFHPGERVTGADGCT